MLLGVEQHVGSGLIADQQVQERADFFLIVPGSATVEANIAMAPVSALGINGLMSSNLIEPRP